MKPLSSRYVVDHPSNKIHGIWANLFATVELSSTYTASLRYPTLTKIYTLVPKPGSTEEEIKRMEK